MSDWKKLADAANARRQAESEQRQREEELKAAAVQREARLRDAFPAIWLQLRTAVLEGVQVFNESSNVRVKLEENTETRLDLHLGRTSLIVAGGTETYTVFASLIDPASKENRHKSVKVVETDTPSEFMFSADGGALMSASDAAFFLLSDFLREGGVAQ